MRAIVSPIAGASGHSPIKPGDWYLDASGRNQVRRHNFSAASAPTPQDDGADGYSVGSLWVDVSADVAYVCLDASEGAAVWHALLSGGGSAGSVPLWSPSPYTLAGSPIYSDGSGVAIGASTVRPGVRCDVAGNLAIGTGVDDTAYLLIGPGHAEDQIGRIAWASRGTMTWSLGTTKLAGGVAHLGVECQLDSTSRLEINYDDAMVFRVRSDCGNPSFDFRSADGNVNQLRVRADSPEIIFGHQLDIGFKASSPDLILTPGWPGQGATDAQRLIAPYGYFGPVSSAPATPSSQLHVRSPARLLNRPAMLVDKVFSQGGDSIMGLRLTLNDWPGGGYLYSHYNEFGLVHNADYVYGEGWTALQQISEQIRIGNAEIGFYIDTGLTIGGTFTPTPYAKLTASGWSVTGAISASGTVTGGHLQGSGLTSGRVVHVGADGLLMDSAGLEYDGTRLQVTSNDPAGRGMLDLKYALDGGAASIAWINSSGTRLWRIGGGLQVAQSELSFDEGTTSRLYLRSGGHVGIGTTDPQERLHVVGTVYGSHLKDSSLTSGRVVYVTVGGQLADASGFTFDGTTLSAPTVRAYDASSGAAAMVCAAAADQHAQIQWCIGTSPKWAIYRPANSSNLVVHEIGVGDQVTFPAGGGITLTGTLTAGHLKDTSLTSGRLVHVATGGQLTDSAQLTFATTGLAVNNLVSVTGSSAIPADANGLHLYFASDTGYITATHPGTANRSLVLAGLDLSFYTNGAVAGKWDSSGRLGIGTTTPAAQLHVYGGNAIISQPAGTTADLVLDQSGIRAWHFQNLATSGDLSLTDGAVLAMYWKKESGRVGIGTTEPSARLHLAGSTGQPYTAPVKLTAGSLLQTPEDGAEEYDGSTRYITLSGGSRKGYLLDDGARLTAGRIPAATSGGRLVDGPLPAPDGTYTNPTSITISKGIVTAIS